MIAHLANEALCDDAITTLSTLMCSCEACFVSGESAALAPIIPTLVATFCRAIAVHKGRVTRVSPKEMDSLVLLKVAAKAASAQVVGDALFASGAVRLLVDIVAGVYGGMTLGRFIASKGAEFADWERKYPPAIAMSALSLLCTAGRDQVLAMATLGAAEPVAGALPFAYCCPAGVPAATATAAAATAATANATAATARWLYRCVLLLPVLFLLQPSLVLLMSGAASSLPFLPSCPCGSRYCCMCVE